MTLVEFLAPLKKSTRRIQCLAVLYYFREYKNQPALTAVEIKKVLQQARIPKAATANVPDVLAKSGHLVDAPENSPQGHRLWRLTESGATEVRGHLDLPAEPQEVERDAGSLTTLALTIPDDLSRSYVEEAILCLRVGALRAAVVFLWSGVARTLQDRLLSHGKAAVNAALQKNDPRSKPVRKIDDFAMIKDSSLLLAARDLGEIDKGQWHILDESLGLRNRCGHPTNYKPGPKKVSSFIEDTIGVLFK